MPTLTYFDFNGGRGEDCRLALHVAGVDFTDDRVAGPTWGGRKAKTPFGALPVYEENGKRIAQSNAILSYVGRKHGLHPSDAWTAAEHEAIMASVEDLRAKVPSIKGLEEAEAKAAREEFANGWLKQWAASVESHIEGPFLAGDKLQVADLKLFNVGRGMKTYDHVPEDALNAFPKLLGLVEAVGSHPRVADWYASRE